MMQQNKIAVVAGNGPSITKIDYRRLPEQYDVFRCNQFFYETKYYLGKKVKGAIGSPLLFQERFYTLKILESIGEYEIEDIYCRFNDNARYGNVTYGIHDPAFYFPNVINIRTEMKKIPQLHEIEKFYALYYQQEPTFGIYTLLMAIAQGYKTIFLTGIDFYNTGEAYFENRSNISNVPEFIYHSQNIDLHFISHIVKQGDIKLFSLNEDNSLLNKIVPLAPIVDEKKIFHIKNKVNQYAIDKMPIPDRNKIIAKNTSIFFRIKTIIYKNGMSEKIKKNYFFIFFSNFFDCFKILFYLFRGL